MNDYERQPDPSRKIFGISYAGAGQAVVKAGVRMESVEIMTSTERAELHAEYDDCTRAEQIAQVTGNDHVIGRLP